MRTVIGSMLLLLPFTSWASLGDTVASVQADQAHLKGTLRSEARQAYVMHEIKASTGTMVREYASPAGSVYGVAWQGPFRPDLRQLLGSHYDAYVQAAEQAVRTRHGHGPLTVELPGLVVQSGGHQRDFHGRAYIPQMVPQGVSTSTIQ